MCSSFGATVFMQGSYVAELHTLDEDREVETSCYRAV